MSDRKFQKGLVTVGTDKGKLRISLPTGLVTALRQQGYSVSRYTYVGLDDSRQNRVKLGNVVEMMNQDLKNPHAAFDPTLEKYLDLLKPRVGSGTKTFVLSGKPECTIQEAWDDWLVIKQPQVQPSTFITRYKGRYETFIKQFRNLPINEETALEIVNFLRSQNDRENPDRFLSQLRQAVGAKVEKGEVKFNPFSAYAKFTKAQKKSKQLEAEEDRKAFDRDDMETIIKAFYNHRGCSDYAPLIEFMFLSGCRPGEARGLTWDKVDIPKSIKIVQSLDMVTNELKETKTGELRLFSLEGNHRLINLLVNQKKYKSTGYVFTTKGRPLNHYNVRNRWAHNTNQYPGIVRRLAQSGQIKQYLKLYATRHTYISLAANKIAEQYPKEQLLSGLKLLADSVGNSVEVILEHYLDWTVEVKLPVFD